VVTCVLILGHIVINVKILFPTSTVMAKNEKLNGPGTSVVKIKLKTYI
jgi:hypothetical protein